METRSFTPFPVLTTERLTLRQLSTTDAPNIFALRSDPEINKYLGRQASKTLEDAINFINRINDSIIKNDSLYWAITLTDPKIFIGTIYLFEFSEEKNTCEIGYELLTHFQGQGIMIEAAKQVIDYAFHTLKVQKMEAFFHKDNQSSIKLLKKLSFGDSNEPDKTNPDLIYYHLTNSMDHAIRE